MKIARHFTKAGHDPLEGIPFVPRTSRISKLDGTVVFEAKDVMVPETWSQVAVDILAQKYFPSEGHRRSQWRGEGRAAGLPSPSGLLAALGRVSRLF